MTALVATQLLYRARGSGRGAAPYGGGRVAGPIGVGDAEQRPRRGRARAYRRRDSVDARHDGVHDRSHVHRATSEWELSSDGRRAARVHSAHRAEPRRRRDAADERPPAPLDPAQRRFLDALAYYAALAVDRVRLVAEAEHAEALREADRLKDIVLASVSHDLRTPLTTIKALAQSEALRGNDSAAAIEEQADRLTRLVSDLLDLSRLKGGAFGAAGDQHGRRSHRRRGATDARTVRDVSCAR